MEGAETDILREPISRLSAAIRRIGGSLDVATVARTTVEEARALTGARFGAVVMSGEDGLVTEYVTSGFEPEQHDRLLNWSVGPRFFEHLRELAKPLQLLDLAEYIRSLGWPSDAVPCQSFQGTPMVRAGVHVGTFFLGGKAGEDGEVAFTDADAELLLLFASQAATAIHNAQITRDEWRLRADLEALVETTPVGVCVFDATTRSVLRVNQEARRIVAGLETPGLSMEELAQALTCRRGDGREVSLDHVSTAETLRAEEMELVAPDGRSVRTLVSATPSRSRTGGPLSVVVTMQDLAALKDLERSRTAFLSMVSHELRAPLAAIKGSAVTVLRASRAYDSMEMQQFFRIVEKEADRTHGEPHWRVARHGAHRDGHAAGGCGANNGGRTVGSCPQHLPERRWTASVAVGSTSRSATGGGGRATHRAGSEQPHRQCGEALPRRRTHPDCGDAPGRLRGDFRHGPGRGGVGGTPAASVQQGRRARRCVAGRAGACDLQGARGSAWRAHSRGE
ncbi:MAG: GAF domain-containing protein [Gammaproteobacteria bacterium]|nr:GAF domain-containing protein [Gammaproteobacteria bacterium]